MSLISSTALLNSVCTEIQEMSKLVIDGNVTNMYDNEGGISIPVTVQPNIVEYDYDGTRSSYDLYNMINHDCTYVPMNLGDALKMVSSIISMDTDNRIYGVTWVAANSSLKRFNLLHPIIVDAILSQRINCPLTAEGKLYIYEYTSDVAKLPLDSMYTEAYIDIWTSVFTALGTMYQPSTQHRCSTNLEALANNIRTGTPIGDLRCVFNASGINPTNVVTPVALLTRDMLFPYYGVVVSEKRSADDPYYSRDVTPMTSCNVSPNGGRPREWGSTCTGNYSNAIYASLRTLCNANTHSAFHDNVLWGSFKQLKMYVKVTQEYSCSLIDAFFNVTVEVVEEVTETEDVEPVTSMVDGVEL